MFTQLFVNTQLMLGNINKPAPQAPPGVGSKMDTILGWAMYLAMGAVIAGVLVGAGLIAVGKMSNNHGAGGNGGKVLGGALAGGIVLAVGYGVVTSLMR